MNFKNLLTDDDAVSPVIGVILMVAITVILAAVIGTFVLGLGDQVSNTSPSASFTFDYTSGTAAPGTNCGSYGASGDSYLEVTHDGGDSITASQITLTDGDVSNNWQDCSDATNDVTAGASAQLNKVESTDTVRVTWQSANGGDTATLGKWTGPDA